MPESRGGRARLLARVGLTVLGSACSGRCIRAELPLGIAATGPRSSASTHAPSLWAFYQSRVASNFLFEKRT